MAELLTILRRKGGRAARPARRVGAVPAQADSHKLILICGAGSSGKTYLTQQVLAIDYDVATDRADRYYRLACEGIGVPREHGHYHFGEEARRIRDGSYEPATVERFWRIYEELLREHLQNAISWGVTPVIEGITLAYSDEVEWIVRVARELAGGDISVFRMQVRPSLRRWNRNRGSKTQRASELVVSSARRRAYRQSMAAAAPEPVAGVEDHVVEDSGPSFERLMEEVGLRRHRWYQRFALGPIETNGPSTATDKTDAVLDRDVEGKRVLDVCCATGVVSLLLKQRGAAEVVGVERDPRRFCKALELRKTLVKNTPLDAGVHLRLGDALDVVPSLPSFDTVVFFGALHYFSDYERTLAMIGRAAREAIYVEFNFADAGNDTRDAPPGIHQYRRSGNGQVIYLGSPATVTEIIGRSLPDFTIEERREVPPPGPRHRHKREIWRMRRVPP